MSDPFLARIVQLLVMSRKDVARTLGVTDRELSRLEKAQRGQLVDMTDDPMWADVARMVDMKLGELFAVREELTRKLASDRKARMARRVAFKRGT